MRPVSGSARRVVWITIAAAVFWGLWWWPLRWLAGSELGILAASTLVYGAGALALLPFILARPAAIRDGGPALWCSAILFAFTLVSWNLALIWGQVARVTLLFYLSPVWALLLAYLFLGQCPDRRRLFSIALGLGGAAVLFGGPALWAADWSLGIGDLLGLVSGGLFAATIVSAQKLPGHATALRQAFFALLIAAVATASVGGMTALTVTPPTPLTLAAAVVIGALVMVPGVVMMLYGGNQLEPSRVTLLLILEVPVAAISAAVFAGEPLGPLHLISGVMIVLAAVMESRPVLPHRS
ncbi:DMT family transporter [Alphaproteobacteria bacterium]|nr:DMT family transporter [Alphaproteobacteria bacterium]